MYILFKFLFCFVFLLISFLLNIGKEMCIFFYFRSVFY